MGRNVWWRWQRIRGDPSLLLVPRWKHTAGARSIEFATTVMFGQSRIREPLSATYEASYGSCYWLPVSKRSECSGSQEIRGAKVSPLEHAFCVSQSMVFLLCKTSELHDCPSVGFQ